MVGERYLDLVSAYIAAYGFCYLIASFKRDFHVIRPNFPILLTKSLLFAAGIAHLLAVFLNSSYLAIPLAFLVCCSCVAHWSGKILWNGILADYAKSQGAYVSMALFDLIDATCLLSKVVIL